jgi:hypothetical protein
VRGMATGEILPQSFGLLVWREFLTGCAMGVVLAVLGFVRVWLFSRDVVAAFAIASTLLCIVVVATTVGALLPLMLLKVGSDPANAGPSVQVCPGGQDFVQMTCRTPGIASLTTERFCLPSSCSATLCVHDRSSWIFSALACVA